MAIEKLSDDLINQIAAGEVIENPSAVIKELIENSIDAGSSHIDIELDNAGFKRIQIKDNGSGISKQDLINAPKRHATSKIKNFDDLYNIKSMGFRGEALASIFSIAKTKILSKTNKQDLGYVISYEDLNEIKSCGCDIGTTVIVEDLFYNTPARKKYLKSENLELRDVVEVVKRFQIIYPYIKFSLKNNNTILSNKPIFEEDIDNIYYVLGKDLKEKIHKVFFEKNGIKVSGFIGNPTILTYGFKKNQFLFVNKRFIKSKLLVDAIYAGFGSNLMSQRHPFFIFNLEIDPEIIDVNVHPSKIEIKFENELEIFNFFKETIENFFENTTLFKDFEVQEKNKSLSEVLEEKQKHKIFNSDFQDEFSNKNNFLNSNQVNVDLQSDLNKQKDENKSFKTYFSKEMQKKFHVNQENIEYLNKKEEDNDDFNSSFSTPGPLFYELEEYRILGQLNKMFIILETKDGMLLVDQHVASEKYLYEEFLNNYNFKTKVKKQQLLKPVIIFLDKEELLLYKENKEILDLIGFESEIFGGNEIIIRAVPININNKIISPELLKNYLHEILVNKTIKCLEEEKYAKIASLACRSAIMAGDDLSFSSMKKLIEQLRYLKQPFQCPHGRPTFLRYSYYELEKKIKRIV